MNVKSWLKQAKKQIDPLDAELIAMAVLGYRDRSELTLNETRELEEDFCGIIISREKTMNEYLERRKNGEPLAYVLGVKEFYGRDFTIDNRVLIPRPETETAIDIVKELIQKLPMRIDGYRRRIVDVGTGSGCIAVTLALEIDPYLAKVVALDSYYTTLEVYMKNARDYGVVDMIEHKISDLLDQHSTKLRFDNWADIVVANLPYVDETWEWLDQEALAYEPAKALYAAEGGLALIKRLIQQVAKREDNLYLVLESDESQHVKIINYAKKHKLKHLETRGLMTVFENPRYNPDFEYDTLDFE